MKLATAAYPLDPHKSWADYAAKIEEWLRQAADQGVELAVFPEYGAMEVSMLAGEVAASDPEGCMVAVSDLVEDIDDLHSDLATRHNLHICAASGPVYDDATGPRPVNRARLFAPGGGSAIQDKQIMTRYERDVMNVVSGGPLKLFETSLGKIGILTCYDSEFPLLGRALHDADLILAPSCTEALSGYWRVRIGAMARALETQCVTVMASLVGTASWTPHADATTGMGGIFSPPDQGFPDTGVIAIGELNRPGWTIGEVDLAAVAHVRADGRVLGRTHWVEQGGRDGRATPEQVR